MSSASAIRDISLISGLLLASMYGAAFVLVRGSAIAPSIISAWILGLIIFTFSTFFINFIQIYAAFYARGLIAWVGSKASLADETALSSWLHLAAVPSAAAIASNVELDIATAALVPLYDLAAAWKPTENDNAYNVRTASLSAIFAAAVSSSSSSILLTNKDDGTTVTSSSDVIGESSSQGAVLSPLTPLSDPENSNSARTSFSLNARLPFASSSSSSTPTTTLSLLSTSRRHTPLPSISDEPQTDGDLSLSDHRNATTSDSTVTFGLNRSRSAWGAHGTDGLDAFVAQTTTTSTNGNGSGGGGRGGLSLGGVGGGVTSVVQTANDIGSNGDGDGRMTNHHYPSNMTGVLTSRSGSGGVLSSRGGSSSSESRWAAAGLTRPSVQFSPSPPRDTAATGAGTASDVDYFSALTPNPSAVTVTPSSSPLLASSSSSSSSPASLKPQLIVSSSDQLLNSQPPLPAVPATSATLPPKPTVQQQQQSSFGRMTMTIRPRPVIPPAIGARALLPMMIRLPPGVPPGSVPIPIPTRQSLKIAGVHSLSPAQNLLPVAQPPQPQQQQQNRLSPLLPGGVLIPLPRHFLPAPRPSQ